MFFEDVIQQKLHLRKKTVVPHCEARPHFHRNRWENTFRCTLPLQMSQLCLSTNFVARLHTVQVFVFCAGILCFE